MESCAPSVSRLPHPVLIVPGGDAQWDGLPGVWKALTAGDVNRYGGSWDASQREDFVHQDAAANVYTLHYSRPFNTYAHNASEVQEAIDDIRTRNRCPEVDVVAECKGAEEVRELIRQGSHGIRNLVLLTPMNHGLPMTGDVAKAATVLIRKLHLPWPKLHLPLLASVFDGRQDPDTMQAMEELGGDWHVGSYHNNPALEQLNTPQNQRRERAAVHSLTVLGGTGYDLGAGWGLPGLPSRMLRGDSAVPQYSSFMPLAENFYLPVRHATEDRSPAFIAKLTEALVTDGHPSHDEHYTTTAIEPSQTLLGQVLRGVDKAVDAVCKTFPVHAKPQP